MAEVQQLVDMGFPEADARLALKQCQTLDRAVDRLLSGLDLAALSGAEETTAPRSNFGDTLADSPVRDASAPGNRVGETFAARTLFEDAPRNAVGNSFSAISAGDETAALRSTVGKASSPAVGDTVAAPRMVGEAFAPPSRVGEACAPPGRVVDSLGGQGQAASVETNFVTADQGGQQSSPDQQASIEELEGLLRQSAQWGQYLVQRNDDLEAENVRLKRESDKGGASGVAELESRLSNALLEIEELADKTKQLEAQNRSLRSNTEETIREDLKELIPSLGGNVADWLVDFALGKVEDKKWRSAMEEEQERAKLLQVRTDKAEAAVSQAHAEAFHLQEQVLSLMTRAEQGEMAAKMTQTALEVERGETSALRAEASRLRQQLHEQLENQELQESSKFMSGGTQMMSLAAELDGAGDGSSPLTVASTPKVSEDLLLECDMLRSRVEHVLAENGKSMVNGTSEPSSSPVSAPVAIQGLRSAVNALLCEVGASRENGKIGKESDQADLLRQIDDLRQERDLLRKQLTLGSQMSKNKGAPSDAELRSRVSVCDSDGGDGVGIADSIEPAQVDSDELRQECQQLRKEVESATEWVSEARRLTEAKRGMLSLHETLASRTGQPSADEVKKLRQAVVRAAEAEREAQELLAAKQERLAETEALLRECEKVRLDEVISMTSPKRGSSASAIEGEGDGQAHSPGDNVTRGAAVFNLDDCSP